FSSKIVKLWLRTRRGGDRKQSVGLLFLSARCKDSRILAKFVPLKKQTRHPDGVPTKYILTFL
ncbi:hypothetical protein EII40_10955, partial [Tannerella forsythia]